ncbi:MAG TPA: Bax inhibitor-1 family protein [Miltoncostaea sp.]|nr:Bax inhibitor-1 family protein [Miltoncostaea sp.]
MRESPDQYGYSPETWERAGAADRADSRAIFGKVMFLVAVTAGFTAAGAYIGRDLSGGWALGAWIAAIVLTIAIGFARRKDEATPMQMGMLFGIGLLLGLAIGPTLNAYANLEDGGTLIAQAAGATALFMGVLGAVGYSTKRDLSGLGRISFFGLIGLLLFGIVAIFVNIPAEQVIWCVFGLVVFAGLTVFDFWRLRRAGSGDVALIALSIYLDAFNVFLFMLQILGGGRD